MSNTPTGTLVPITNADELVPFTKLNERRDVPITENTARWYARDPARYPQFARCVVRNGKRCELHVPSYLHLLSTRTLAAEQGRAA